MRFSLATASCAVVISALLAGCSNAPQSSQTLPLAGGTQAISGPVGAVHFFPKGKLTPLQLLKLQAEGKLPGPVPRAALQKQLKIVESGKRPLFKKDKGGGVAMWVSDTDNGYLVGQNSKGKATEGAIDVEDNGCYYPITLQVDSSENIWTSCEYNFNVGDVGSTQEYGKTGTLENTFNQGCPSPVSECEYWYSYSFSSGANANYVESSVTFSEEDIDGYYYYGSGFEWWPASDPTATPTYINLGEDCDPVCDMYYGDVDSSGNIWFTYYGNSGGSEYGYGLGEITNAFTDPEFVSIEPTGTYGFAGGVYVGNDGKTLNVIDQDSRTNYEYSMPVSAGQSPSKTLGPTVENFFDEGDPVSGAFSPTDSKWAAGDAEGWLDLCASASNKCKAVQSLSIEGPEGAAYTPSDRY
jgi:hypothetical protein